MKLEALQALGLVPRVGDVAPGGVRVVRVTQDPNDWAEISVEYFVPTPIDFVKVKVVLTSGGDA